MNISISATPQEMGVKAGDTAAELIRQTLAERGAANIIVATGASQFEVLARLIQASGIDWSKVTIFHLDEYAGLPESHPASFRRYLRERLVAKLPKPPAAFHAINGEGDLVAECARLGELIRRHPIDVTLCGIGENGHLAFNDPPADFDTDQPYLVVGLDEACRRQQLGEGWFPSLEAVPKQAISMSIRQIMLSKTILCSVPDQRKAEAVKNSLEGPVTNQAPASILQKHPRTTIYLDTAAASLLTNKK